MVKFEGQSWDNPKVIGFASSPKACGFQFRLTLAWSGQVAAAADIRRFEVYDSSKNWVDVTSSYDEATGCFSVTFNDPEDGKDTDGYWVFFTPARDSNYLYTQYPTRYKWDDMYRAVDRIKPGRYEDVLHYFRQVVTDNKAINGGAVVLDTPFERTLTVESTVPYEGAGSYWVPSSQSISAHGTLNIPAGSPSWMYGAFGGEGSYDINANTVGGTDSCQVEGIGSSVTVDHTTPKETGDSFVIGVYGPGTQAFVATITDTSEFVDSVMAWRYVNYEYQETVVTVDAFTSPTTCYVSVGLNANYDY